jgi:hypothetical protein
MASSKLLDFERMHVVDHATVCQDLALREGVVDRKLLGLLGDCHGVLGADDLRR